MTGFRLTSFVFLSIRWEDFKAFHLNLEFMRPLQRLLQEAWKTLGQFAHSTLQKKVCRASTLSQAPPSRKAILASQR